MKPEVIFGLESAAWPALLVNTSGVLMRANGAASAMFGPALAGDAPKLAALWSPENGVAPEDFLKMWEHSPAATMDLKFRTAKGQEKFTTAVSTFDNSGNKWFVLQLMPAFERTVAPAAGLATAPVTPPPAETKPASDVNGVLLKQKLDCALQLARSVSLDFNNALTGILGHTSLLLGKAEPGHPWRQSLLEVEKSAERAAEIASELQTFSRQEKESPRVPPGNLNAVVSRCVEFFRNAHGVKIAWNTQLEKNLFGARFDEAKVQQALTKIMENAVDAAGMEGRGQIIVTTRNVDLTAPTQDRNVRLAAGAYVCVEIADNGSGIDPEVLPRIFEPFFTTKKPPHRGLGLALVYGIITNHGGGVAVSSQPGMGTSARVYLAAERQLVQENLGAGEDLHGSGTILVVDDEELVLRMGETILTDFGYKVITAANGQKALALLSRDDIKVDLVLTDLVMPGMGGRELVEKIRQLAPKLKILCMSGYLMPADKEAVSAYLQKPFSSSELLAKVKFALNRAAAGE